MFVSFRSKTDLSADADGENVPTTDIRLGLSGRENVVPFVQVSLSHHEAIWMQEGPPESGSYSSIASILQTREV